MKFDTKSILSATALLVGGFIGASALVVFANSSDGTWTSAPVGVPNNNVAAPINVGVGAQTKAGDLGVNAFVASLQSFFAQKVTIGTTISPATIQIVDGNQANGKVLQSDANGNAKWVATSTLGISGGSTGVTSIIAGTGITISPTTGTGAVTINANNTQVQTRVAGVCSAGLAIASINSDGTVGCSTVPVSTNISCTATNWGVNLASCTATCSSGKSISSWSCSFSGYNSSNKTNTATTGTCSASNSNGTSQTTTSVNGSGSCI